MTTVALRNCWRSQNHVFATYNPYQQRRHRALLLRCQRERKARSDLQRAIQAAQEANYCVQRTAAERDDAKQRLREALPVYVRIRELTERHYGQAYAMQLAWDMQAWTHCFMDLAQDRVADMSRQVHYLAREAGEKFAHEIAKQLGNEFNLGRLF